MELKTKVSVNVNFKKISKSVREEIIAAIKLNAVKLTNNIKSGKLTGQVLKVRTGRLRNSIHKIDYESNDNFKSVVRTNVKYAAVHEYGFSGAVSVKSHMRTIKQAFGKSISPKTITVNAYTRNANYPQRSFMRTALAEIRNDVLNDVNKAIGRAIKK